MGQRIILIGKTQYENLGDFLISRLLIKKLQERVTVYYDSWGVPKDYFLKLRSAFNKSDNFLLLRHSIRSLYFLFDQLVHRRYSSIVFPPGAIDIVRGNKSDMWVWLRRYCGLLILRMVGLKIVCMGVSFPDVKTHSFFVRSILRQFHHIGIRTKSQAFEFHKVIGNQVYYCPDIIFLKDLDNKMKASSSDRSSSYVVLSFRGTIPEVNGSHYTLMLKEIVNEVVRVFASNKVRVWLAFQSSTDRQFMSELAQGWEGHECVSFRDAVLNEEEASLLYSSARLVVSNRLHVLLTAIIQNTPVIAITDTKRHNKVVDIMDDMGLVSRMIDIRDNIHTIPLLDLGRQEPSYIDGIVPLRESNACMIMKNIETAFFDRRGGSDQSD